MSRSDDLLSDWLIGHRWDKTVFLADTQVQQVWLTCAIQLIISRWDKEKECSPAAGRLTSCSPGWEGKASADYTLTSQTWAAKRKWNKNVWKDKKKWNKQNKSFKQRQTITTASCLLISRWPGHQTVDLSLLKQQNQLIYHQPGETHLDQMTLKQLLLTCWSCTCLPTHVTSCESRMRVKRVNAK